MVIVAYTLTKSGAFKVAEGTGQVDVRQLQDSVESTADRVLKEIGAADKIAGMIIGDRAELKLNCKVYDNYQDLVAYAKKAV